MEKPKRSGSKRKSTETAPAKAASRKPAASPGAKSAVPAASPPPPAKATPASSPPSTPPVSKAPTPTPTPAPAARKAAATKSPAPTPPAPRAAAKSSSAPSAPPPGILLEGDASTAAAPTGPGGRYVLGPKGTPAPTQAPSELPAAYGTRRLLLVARDPHWLYAHWDLTEDQRREYNRRSVDGHLVIRIYLGSVDGELAVEQDVHPESSNWFVHVPKAGARYAGELGYRGPGRVWNRISASSPTITPADSLSSETWARFETLPFDVPMTQLVRLVREAARDHAPLLEAIRELRAAGHPGLPPVTPARAEAPWTPAQEQALAAVINLDEVRRVWIGSLEITELLRRQLLHGLSSMERARGEGVPGAAAASGVSSLSSPFGGASAPPRGFWFNVNAEVIVYGATEPDATVRIGGRPITLRSDGSFSFRFALPDGSYPLPIAATSADGVETRQAELRFQRESHYSGQVGRHPQDPSLRPPSPENTR